MSNYNQGYVPPNQLEPTNYNVSQPISQPILSQNQVTSIPTVNFEGVLRSNPAFVVCPHCRQGGVTRAETSCSILNTCCCICTYLGPWIIFQACRGKDINCCDANHFCVACGAKLYTYNAC
jgi:hypothetical protein